MNGKLRKIYRKIKKHNVIVIARHVGPDPDCLAAQLALKEMLLHNFPSKKIYSVGCPAATFRYLGELDKFDEAMYKKSLLIVLDTPDKKRVDGVDPDRFSDSIKIDHHPFIETFCDVEWIDDSASSAAQMVLEFIYHFKLKYTKKIAEKLFTGIVADTNRFLFNYTTPKTFQLIARLIKETKIEFTPLYEQLYLRPYKEIKFQGYISQNLTITENGFAYIKLDENVLKSFGVDPATAGNMINEYNYINEIYSWAMFSLDKTNSQIRGTIRSRGPIINETASLYGGGGHIFASGVRLKDFDEVDLLVKDLDEVCRVYKETLKK